MGKGISSEGGSALRYGFFGLGNKSLGKTLADADSIGTDVHDVWCLFPAACTGSPTDPPSTCAGGVPSSTAITWASQLVTALKGKYPDKPRLCDGNFTFAHLEGRQAATFVV